MPDGFLWFFTMCRVYNPMPIPVYFKQTPLRIRCSSGQPRKSHNAGGENKVLQDRPIWGRGHYLPRKNGQCPLPSSSDPGIPDKERQPSGPLFVLQDGWPLSRSMLVEKVRQALRRAGIDASEYNGHSFRIGAATTAAAQGISVPLIKTLGRWRSEAFHTYIKIPSDTLASVSATLSQQ